MRKAVVVMLALLLANCATPQSRPTSYEVFFVPGTVELTPEAQQIVRAAAENARQTSASKIDIAVPSDAPGGAMRAEGRFTAIQNILSASGIGPGVLQRASLSDAAASLPGASDRAEIRLLNANRN